jgi:hypothetical protein
MLYRRQHPNTPLRPGTPVDPHRACEILEWGVGTPRSEAALEYLEAELALEQDPLTVKAVGPKQYVWGVRAAQMLGEE